jgi:hypothetical protein
MTSFEKFSFNAFCHVNIISISTGLQMYPLKPSIIISVAPPVSVKTAGIPQAKASMVAIEKVSTCVEHKVKRSLIQYNGRISVWENQEPALNQTLISAENIERWSLC